MSIFFNFVQISRLVNFVRQHQNTAKHVASSKLTIPLTKQTEKSLGSDGLVFLIIFYFLKANA